MDLSQQTLLQPLVVIVLALYRRSLVTTLPIECRHFEWRVLRRDVVESPSAMSVLQRRLSTCDVVLDCARSLLKKTA